MEALECGSLFQTVFSEYPFMLENKALGQQKAGSGPCLELCGQATSQSQVLSLPAHFGKVGWIA